MGTPTDLRANGAASRLGAAMLMIGFLAGGCARQPEAPVALGNDTHTLDDDAAVEMFARRFAAWAKVEEERARREGVPLRPRLREIAHEIGVTNVDQVRILVVDTIPFPEHDPFLVAMGQQLGLVGPGIVGNAQIFGEVILSRPEYAESDEKMAHELGHVMQVQREGSFEHFLIRYLHEVRQYGYRQAPLEVEAYALNERYRDQ
jgi:hypothetical protein